MTITKFVANSSATAVTDVERRFYNILCPIFVKHYKPFLRLIKAAIFYKLFRDVEQKLYNLEEMLNSGQIDEYTQLITPEAKKVRLKCACNLKNESTHRRSKKKLDYKFDADEISICYRCKEYYSADAFISIFRERLAKTCYICREQDLIDIYAKPCSKCI